MYAARAMAAHAKLIKKFHSIMTRSCLSETVAFLKEKKKKRTTSLGGCHMGAGRLNPKWGSLLTALPLPNSLRRMYDLGRHSVPDATA